MASRNSEYYFQDVVFQVENELFKAPRHLFTGHSQIFRNMFEMPIPEGVEPDGSSDKQPLVLHGIKSCDFIQLLRCIYPLQFNGKRDVFFTLKEWESILKLAALYGMMEVKDFAIEHMAPLLGRESPSLQIHFARMYDVPGWLEPGEARLVDRRGTINEEDVRLIGLAEALKICALREKDRARCDSCELHRDLHSPTLGPSGLLGGRAPIAIKRSPPQSK